MRARARYGLGAACLSLLALALAPSAQAACPDEAVREAQHSTYLPDCRAYEMVSPPQKSGGDVAADGRRTNAAADGNAAGFISQAGFGDVRGSSVATEYIARRSTDSSPGTNGWATHAIIPPQDSTSPVPLLNGGQPLYRLFSPDLSTGVFQAWTPLTDEPNVAGVENLYLRTDLLEPGVGTYSLLTSCPLCESAGPLPPPNGFDEGGFFPFPLVAGASADFTHVLFESRLKLTSDVPPCAPNPAEGCVHLYESEGGVVRLAGILPGGSAAARSMAGVGAGMTHGVQYTPHVISGDGRRAIFTVPQTAEALDGNVYERIDNGMPGAETLWVNASERTDCADHDPCSGTPEPDPGGHKPALYQDASADGTRIFFTSQEELTDEAGSGLYMYDTTKPAGQRLTLIGPGQIVAVSDDGTNVYSLVSGEGESRIVLWHEGTKTLVGKLANHGDEGELIWTVRWNVGAGRETRITPDGKHLLFISRSGEGLLSAHGGTDVDQSACLSDGYGLGPGCRTLYLYSADTNTLQCVSCGEAGTVTAPATDSIRTDSGASATTPKLSHALSDDGRFVFFVTEQPLVPEDTNEKSDVYEFDSETDEVSLISSGTSPADSYFMDASPDGEDVFFTTRQRLVGWDRDGNTDLYDARQPLPGHPAGFPEPPPAPEACQGDACLPTAPTAPSIAGAGSGGEFPGNPSHGRAGCPKGRKAKKVKGKVRCVKPKSHKHHRRAGAKHGGVK
jgi:hypothetical protein